MKKKTSEVPEIVIPSGYEIDKFLEMTEEFGDEEPIFTEEVKIRFE